VATWTLRDPDLVAVRKLGAGGCGVTFQATRQSTGQALAVKILHPELAADESRRDAFLSISRQAQAIGHPQVVGVEEICSDAGQIYLVSPLLEGVDLTQLMGRVRSVGSLSTPSALQIIRQICTVLDACAPLPHGALWPENIIFDWAGTAHLLDFGAWLMPIDHVAAADVDPIHRYAHCTPEHMRGQPVTSATDVFSLGVLLFELLTGDPLFSGRDANRLIESVGNAAVGAIRSIAAPVQGLLSHCLQRSANARFQDTGVLGREIDRLIDGKSQTTELAGLLGGFAPTLAQAVGNLRDMTGIQAERTALETEAIEEALLGQETASEELTDPHGTPFAAEPTVVGEPEPAPAPAKQDPARTPQHRPQEAAVRGAGPTGIARVPLPQTGEFAVASMAVSIEEISAEHLSGEALLPIDSDDPWAALNTDTSAEPPGAPTPAQTQFPPQARPIPEGLPLPHKESHPTALELALKKKAGPFQQFRKRFGWTYLLLGFTVVVCLGALGLLLGRLSGSASSPITARDDANASVTVVADAGAQTKRQDSGRDQHSPPAPDAAKPSPPDASQATDSTAPATEPLPRAGRILIRTNPSATIYIDGRKRGKSPLKLRLRRGRRYTLVATADKRELWVKRFRMPRKTGVLLSQELKEATYPAYTSRRRRGTLAVRCKKYDRRRIFIDRKDSGRSCPKANFFLKPKRYRISFVELAKGKASETFKRIRVKRRKTIVLRPRKRR
jgi:eukaryotic-like serine/threonine-protein kinase